MRHELVGLLLALGFVGCSGSTATPPSGGSDSGADATVVDSGATDASGDPSSSSNEDAGDAGAPVTDAALDAPVACNALDGGTSACRVCCATSNKTGYEAFLQIELACACAGSLCGAPDGAAGDDAGDAGPGGFGEGACTAVCAQTTTTLAGSCEACVEKSVGSESDPGPCQSNLVSDCIPDGPCAAFLACIEGC